jgi:hypothetical protein
VVLFKLKISKERKCFQREEGFGKDQEVKEKTMNQQLTIINTNAPSAPGHVILALSGLIVWCLQLVLVFYNMNMKKLGLFTLGLFFLFLGINDFFIGQTSGFASGDMSLATITFSTSPIEFSLSIAFKVIAGGLFIVKGLSNAEFEK